MKEVEILIGNSQYRISCKKEERERILYLAELINKRLNKISKNLEDADDKTLLVMTALMIEDELERSSDSLVFQDKIDDENMKFNDQDIYDTVSENTDNISDYIEKLAEKIKNY